MGKVIYGMSVSLDGFFEGPQGDLDWSNPDAELHQYFNDLDSAIDIHLYGRRLYEIMAAFWPTVDEDPAAPEYINAYARIWKKMPKVVFSKTLAEVGWNSRLVREDLAGEVQKLKAQPGITISVGGAELAGALMRLGLIDEYQLYIHPVILGAGKPMLAALPEKMDLQLVETHSFGSGVVLLRYECLEKKS